MHFCGWKKGLKTGMYYLRTKAAVDATKVTVPAMGRAAMVQRQGDEVVDEEDTVMEEVEVKVAQKVVVADGDEEDEKADDVVAKTKYNVKVAQKVVVADGDEEDEKADDVV